MRWGALTPGRAVGGPVFQDEVGLGQDAEREKGFLHQFHLQRGPWRSVSQTLGWNSVPKFPSGVPQPPPAGQAP